MSVGPFIINGRFLIRPDTNVVLDQEAGTPTRIEPRHMKLLCTLAAREGQVVERDTLITELWNDYGGADDALTQAVSFLRKVLGDGDRKLIETIPKSGYILHGTITQPKAGSAMDAAEVKPTVRTDRRWLYAAGCGLLLLLAIWYLGTRDAVAPPASVEGAAPDGAVEHAAPPAP